ncbi:MAG: Rid family hydrolase [Acidobacteriota bacterium]
MRNASLTDKAPRPIGPCSQAIVEDGLSFVAGHGCMNPATGKLELGDLRSKTTRVFENMRAILEAAGSSLEKVVTCNVYLRDSNDFAAINEVYMRRVSPRRTPPAPPSRPARCQGESRWRSSAPPGSDPGFDDSRLSVTRGYGVRSS